VGMFGSISRGGSNPSPLFSVFTGVEWPGAYRCTKMEFHCTY
jgi:hypothetical protein